MRQTSGPKHIRRTTTPPLNTLFKLRHIARASCVSASEPGKEPNKNNVCTQRFVPYQRAAINHWQRCDKNDEAEAATYRDVLCERFGGRKSFFVSLITSGCCLRRTSVLLPLRYLVMKHPGSENPLRCGILFWFRIGYTRWHGVGGPCCNIVLRVELCGLTANRLA